MPFPSIEKLESLGVALTKAAGCTEQTPKNSRSIPTEDLLEADKIDEG